jgi:hypothetical protein
MAMETTAILRSVLYSTLRSKSLDEAARAIKVMCTKDDIAAVEQAIAEEKAAETNSP